MSKNSKLPRHHDRRLTNEFYNDEGISDLAFVFLLWIQPMSKRVKVQPFRASVAFGLFLVNINKFSDITQSAPALGIASIPLPEHHDDRKLSPDVSLEHKHDVNPVFPKVNNYYVPKWPHPAISRSE